MDTTNPSRFSSVSVFFPAYNDALSIRRLVIDAFETLRENVTDYEVIVVNDGSGDPTGEVLAELEKQYAPHMRVITHERNRGYGGALRSGFAAASKDLVFYTDGDGQYDVREMPRLLDQMGPDVGLVNGYKLKRSDPWHRIWIGNAYNAFSRFLFQIRIRDIDCDYRLVRRQLLQEIKLESTSGTICLELVRNLELRPYRIVEVGVSHYPRLHGSSQFFRFRSLLTTFNQLIKLYRKLVMAPWIRQSERGANWLTLLSVL
jgi:glycosyltransferase involved in cell wall biosynthesis